MAARATPHTDLIVVGRHTYELEVIGDDSPYTVRVIICKNGTQVWASDEEGWQRIRLGSYPGGVYIWSAFRVVTLPADEQCPTVSLEVDDELGSVFFVEGGWIAACELSVRRFMHGSETARVDLGEVLVGLAWTDESTLRVSVWQNGPHDPHNLPDQLIHVRGSELVREWLEKKEA